MSEALSLAQRYGGTVVPFENLPSVAQSAITVYLGQYGVQPAARYGYVVVPINELLAFVACNADLRADWFDRGLDWSDYAAWYASNDSVPDHGDSVWPILLGDDDDRIEDGWHRFHSYVQKGLSEVPCLYSVAHPSHQEEAMKPCIGESCMYDHACDCPCGNSGVRIYCARDGEDGEIVYIPSTLEHMHPECAMELGLTYV